MTNNQQRTPLRSGPDLAWAERIVARHAAGDTKLSAIALRWAREVLAKWPDWKGGAK